MSEFFTEWAKPSTFQFPPIPISLSSKDQWIQETDTKREGLRMRHSSLIGFSPCPSSRFTSQAPSWLSLFLRTSQGFQPVSLHAISQDSLQVPWQSLSLSKSHSFKRSSVLLRVASSSLGLDTLILSPLYLIQISFPPLSSNLMLLKGIFLDLQILLFSTKFLFKKTTFYILYLLTKLGMNTLCDALFSLMFWESL